MRSNGVNSVATSDGSASGAGVAVGVGVRVAEAAVAVVVTIEGLRVGAGGRRVGSGIAVEAARVGCASVVETTEPVSSTTRAGASPPPPRQATAATSAIQAARTNLLTDRSSADRLRHSIRGHPRLRGFLHHSHESCWFPSEDAAWHAEVPACSPAPPLRVGHRQRAMGQRVESSEPTTPMVQVSAACMICRAVAAAASEGAASASLRNLGAVLIAVVASPGAPGLGRRVPISGSEAGRRSVAQLARAAVSKTAGRGFESLHSCHINAIGIDPRGGGPRELRVLDLADPSPDTRLRDEALQDVLVEIDLRELEFDDEAPCRRSKPRESLRLGVRVDLHRRDRRVPE